MKAAQKGEFPKPHGQRVSELNDGSPTLARWASQASLGGLDEHVGRDSHPGKDSPVTGHVIHKAHLVLLGGGRAQWVERRLEPERPGANSSSAVTSCVALGACLTSLCPSVPLCKMRATREPPLVTVKICEALRVTSAMS